MSLSLLGVTANEDKQWVRKIQLLFGICLAALVLPLSFSGGAVATPAIGRDLGGSPTELTWVTNAFMLSFGSLLMAAGTAADVIGRKTVFVFGIAMFAVVSLALGMAPSVVVLDLLRGLQGVAAAAALAGGSAALAQEFSGDARTRAFSMLGTTFGCGLAFGPILAGGLVEHFGWQAIFLSGTLIGLLSLVVTIPTMRQSRDPDARGFDWPGVILFTATLSFFTFAIIQGPGSGWTSRLVVGLFLGSALALALFVFFEMRSKRPMLDLTLFRYPRFLGVQVLPVATCYSYVVLLVMLPLRMIGVEGMGETGAGLVMMALSAPMLVVPLLAAGLTRWLTAGVISAVGLLVAAAGLVALAFVPVGASMSAFVMPMLVIGFGTAMPWGLMDGLSVSVVPKERAGMATGIFSTTRVAGEGIALAIVAAMLAGFAYDSLSGISAGVSPDLAPMAQLIASGDLRAAAGTGTGIGLDVLEAIYAEAFRSVVLVLAGITVVSAIAVLFFLGKVRTTDTA